MIADYLDDYSVPLDDKGQCWLDLTETAGVSLPKTMHFKPPGIRTINAEVAQKACKKDEDIINAVCEEKELTEGPAKARRIFVNQELPKRPHSEDWKDIAFCDEFHLGIGPQITTRMKHKKRE